MPVKRVSLGCFFAAAGICDARRTMHRMKEITRCIRCSSARWLQGVGFTAVPVLVCTEREGAVDEDDGCTFGAPGEPGTAVKGCDVALGEHAAVDGSRW